MDKIIIADLEVFYRVGVPDEERARPQRLLLTITMDVDFGRAVSSDCLDRTIDYHAVSQRLLQFGENREWKLIEKLAAEIADSLLRGFAPCAVRVEVKKFILPQARFVAVQVERSLES